MPELIEFSEIQKSHLADPDKPKKKLIRALTGKWIDWLVENISANQSLLSLEKVMIDKGFDPEFARISVIGIHDFHVTETKKPDLSPKQLNPDWQHWLRENIVRGCTDDQMITSMSKSGFELALVKNLMIVARAYVAYSDPLKGTVVSEGTYKPDTMRLPAGNQIKIDDHTIQVSSVMRNPCIVVLDNVLTDVECGALIERARGQLQRSGVVDRETGNSVVSDVRTSEGTHFPRGDGEIVTTIERRLSKLTGLDTQRFEPMQILHYNTGGEYKPHNDYFAPDSAGGRAQAKRGGNRIATLILYLNNVEDGGETYFPRPGVEVRPRRGRAVYFEYMNAKHELDIRCEHAGQPVQKGEKWIATKWMRVGNYHQ